MPKAGGRAWRAVRNQDGSPWVPVPLTRTMDELGRDMYVVNILEDYIPGRPEVYQVKVEIEIDGDPSKVRLPQVNYDEERRDTKSVCGDSENGFSLEVEWDQRADKGQHTVRAFAEVEMPAGSDEVKLEFVEFDSATFTVK